MPSFRLCPAFLEERDFRFSTDQRCESSGLSHIKATGGTTLTEDAIHVDGLSHASECLCSQVLALKIALHQSIRRFTDQQAYWALPVLECAKQCWALLPRPTVLVALLHPSLQPQPTQYACPTRRASWIPLACCRPLLRSPMAARIPNPVVLLDVRHLHGPGDSRNRRAAHHRAVGRYAHRSAGSLRYTPADRHAPRPASLPGRVGRRVWWSPPGHRTSR